MATCCQKKKKYYEAFIYFFVCRNIAMKVLNYASFDSSVYEDLSQEAILKCDICHYVAKTKKNLSNHKDKKHGEKKIVCVVCNMRFTYNCELRRHMFVHSENKRFTCEHCDMQFRSRSGLLEHKISKHNFPAKYVCDINDCKRPFISKERFQDHVNRHLGLKQYMCLCCKKEFPTKRNLDSHNLRCNPKKNKEKKFQCTICQMKFIAKTDLKQHKQKHLPGNISCKHCGKTFTWKNNYFRHVKTCSG